MNDSLSNMEWRFCAGYAANGGKGRAAAVEAGYAANSAAVSASKLLRRWRVRQEINRLLAEAVAKNPPKPTPRFAGELIVIEAPTIREGPPSEEPVDDDVALSSTLSRDWTVARLMKNAQMCLGEIEQTLTKIVSRTDADGNTRAVAIQVKAFIHDPAGASAALSILSKELDRREGILPGDDTTAPPPHRADFEKRMGEFAAVVRERLAQQAERAARFNATSTGAAGTNSGKTTNGNGNSHD